MTPQQILDAAYALTNAQSPAEKQFLEGQYTLTGVITSVDTAYDSNYGNITVTSDGNEISVYYDENKKCETYT